MFAQKLPTASMNASWWPALVWLWSLSAAVANDEKVCNSMVIMNSGDHLTSLKNCTVINGHLQIILMDTTTSTDFEETYPLREITEYMVVYRVTGLYNLGKMFPNLMLIRGVHSSMFPGRSLMIHDNPDLREIGFYRLTNITRGSVIISKNPSKYNFSSILLPLCLLRCSAFIFFRLPSFHWLGIVISIEPFKNKTYFVIRPFINVIIIPWIRFIRKINNFQCIPC